MLELPKKKYKKLFRHFKFILPKLDKQINKK